MGFAELAHVTGDGNCRAAYQQIWWSLCEYERHNHGGVLSNEAAAVIEGLGPGMLLTCVIYSCSRAVRSIDNRFVCSR